LLQTDKQAFGSPLTVSEPGIRWYIVSKTMKELAISAHLLINGPVWVVLHLKLVKR